MFGKSHRWLWICVVFLVTLSFPLVVHAQSSFNALREDMRFLQDRSEAVLFFNVFGSNPDFKKHMLSKVQLQDICGGLEACEGYGVNHATFFQAGAEDDDPVADWETANEVGMNWGLQIADTNVGAVSDTINRRSPPFNVIVRFGTGAGGAGFTGPESIINFLISLAGQVGSRQFWAIAGPNEPDLEPWAVQALGAPLYSDGSPMGTFPANDTPEKKNEWYLGTGAKLAEYMKTICAAKTSGQIPVNVQLLSPAFNATSESFVPLVEQVRAHGGFVPGCFSGLALNLYPKNNSVQFYFEEYGIEELAEELGLQIYITETGPIDREFYDKDNGEDPQFRDLPEPQLPTKKDTDNYHYISPIMGLNPLNVPKDVGEIRDSLANQGYQAYCATPTYTIDTQFSGDIEAFIDNVRAGKQAPRDVDVDSTQIIDYTKAQTPIFRDTERKAFLKSDLEEFFGYRELNEDTYAQTEIESAAINSLLSENQKCMKAADALVAQRTMCNKLGVAPEDNCALYYTTVPGTKMTVLDLFKAYEAYKHEKTDEEACHGIVSRADGVSEEFRTGMLNLSLHIEEAYRIAFLVGVVKQKPENPNPLFNFFSRSATIPPSDEVVVISFKIPDIGTNKGTIWQEEPVTNEDGDVLYQKVSRNDQNTRIEAVESGHTYWDDVMTLTRNILIPRKMAEKMDLEGSDERIKLREAAAAATGQGGGSLIYCLMGQAPFGTGSNTCNDEAVKAVVDIINGTWAYDKERVSCDPANLTYEQVNEIGDSARLGGAVDNYKFQFQYGEFILAQIWDNNSTGQDFGTVFKVNPSNWPPQPCNVLEQGQGATGDCTTINFYLVYPMGYDLETLEYVMSRTFLTEDQYEKASQDPDIKNRFNIFDDRVELEHNSNEEEFTDFLDCSIEDGRYVCPEKEFTADVVSSQGPALFLGARVGYWTHEIQKTFHRLNSLAHKYLQACRTTEEFLLDQCGGAATDALFDDKAYCLNRPDKAPIVRDVDNSDMDRFQFYKATGQVVEQMPIQINVKDEDNKFFPKPGELGCNMEMAVRAVDGLTLILSGGKDIVPNNPGNILGCTGRVSASRKLRVLRLPPEYKAEEKAANPNWKPAIDDPGWDTADVMQTSGNSASEIQYKIRLTRGYYRVEIRITNRICQSTQTWVMKDGKELPDDYYVFDLVSDEGCEGGACYDANLQSNMEGGGPVYGRENGEDVILYTIDKANGYYSDSFGCELSFDYSTLKYNNTCGGGRAGDCNDPGIGGDCGFWSGMIDDIKDGKTIGGKRGSDAYYSVFGRYPDASGEMACSHEGNGDPIFGNTIVIRNCETYTKSLDSLRIFGKLIGFTVDWFMTQQPVSFEIPSREVWESIQAASNKHGCDPWLVLALASSEGEEPGYFNDTRPNNAQTIGMFEFLPQIWEDWTRDNNPADPQCTWRQPVSFNEGNKQGLDFSDRANIPAAIDTACRIILYTGMQKYPDDKEKFRNAFTSQLESKENNYGFGWNNNPLQADYVWEFWQKARKSSEEGPKPQPANYPYNICTNGEQPSTPVATPPTGIPDVPPGKNNTGNPPTESELNSWSIDQWKTFFNYNLRSSLPHIGTVTYQDIGVIDEVLYNRQNGVTTFVPELSKETITTCTLDYNFPAGSTPEQKLAYLQNQGKSNGRSQAIGCMASVRIGDVMFSPFGPNQGPDAFRTVWVKPQKGEFANTPIGPILIMDMAAPEHLKQQYINHGADYVGDIGRPLFDFIQTGNPAWNGPQEIIVCDTEQQCRDTQFGQ